MGERTCPDCGAHLDPEEKCDCQEERQEKDPSPASNRGQKQTT